MYTAEFKKYIEDLAAKLPAPGGGSAAALTGALGVALLEMVCNFTLGKKKYAQSQEDVKNILSGCQALRQRLTELVDEDVVIYKKLDEAFKTKIDSEIEAALKQATFVPVEICSLCHRALKFTPALIEKGNSNLVSDVGVGVSLLSAAFESALYNVDINLKNIKDKVFIVKTHEALGPQVKEMTVIKDTVSSKVKNILAAEGET
ncbi:MAG: cyclodeaminase/cyclohydrolase family protein [Candidatus Omnitrophota bacterium]